VNDLHQPVNFSEGAERARPSTSNASVRHGRPLLVRRSGRFFARMAVAALVCLASVSAPVLLAGCGGSSGSNEAESGGEGATGGEAGQESEQERAKKQQAALAQAAAREEAELRKKREAAVRSAAAAGTALP